jgi:hypothetical protein
MARDLSNPLTVSKFDPPKKTGYLSGQYLTKTGKNTYYDEEKGTFKDPKGLVKMKGGYVVDDSFKFKGRNIVGKVK